MFNHNQLPLAEAKVLRIERGDWVYVARALAEVQFPGLAYVPGCGFTLFLEHPEAWARSLEQLANGEEIDAESLIEPRRGRRNRRR